MIDDELKNYLERKESIFKDNQIIFMDRLVDLEMRVYSDRELCFVKLDQILKKVADLEQRIDSIQEAFPSPIFTEQDEHRKIFEGRSLPRRETSNEEKYIEKIKALESEISEERDWLKHYWPKYCEETCELLEEDKIKLQKICEALNELNKTIFEMLELKQEEKSNE